MEVRVAEAAVCFQFAHHSQSLILCSTHSVINLLIKRGRVLWPSEWELAGTGIEVDVFGIWLSVSAHLHLQWGNKQGHSTAHIE